MKHLRGYEQLTPQGKLYDEIRDFFNQRIVGQDHAKETIAQYLANSYNDIKYTDTKGSGPVGVFLLKGPTGVGKTMIVKEAARLLFGDPKALTKIECEKLQSEHEASMLFGAPPGYIGFGKTPLLDPSKVFFPWRKARDDKKLHPLIKRNNNTAVLLFDEIEKMHPDSRQKLLGLLDDGEILLQNGEKLNICNSLVFMTSNIGEHEAINKGPKIGFTNTHDDKNEFKNTILKKRFSPEFLGRIDEIIEFTELKSNFLDILIEKYHNELQQLLTPILQQETKINLSERAKSYIFSMIQPELGMRNVEKYRNKTIKQPLGSIIKIHKLQQKEVEEIFIDYDEHQIKFFAKTSARKTNYIPKKREVVHKPRVNKQVHTPTTSVTDIITLLKNKPSH